jgi:uncharacterized protein YbjQ (UPF0145 family)
LDISPVDAIGHVAPILRQGEDFSMKFNMLFAAAVMAGAALATPALSKDAPKTYKVVNEAVGLPVFPYDITDRPYTVLGEVKAGVRKATVFSAEASQAKIYGELWERAEKMGADAVVKASYGEAHVSAFSWGKTNATGIAVKFTDAPAAAPAAPAAGAAQ